ncbi:MAG: peptide chain release factor N(5)-glutamine methyltransferase [Lachnospiraceae bacterium]|nr:peptide chain release factor N(5)-glutamine methyltransferase [Lachnospiraceae bacterium]
MVLSDVLRYGEETLQNAGIADAKIDAFTLLEMASGVNRTTYLLYKDHKVNEAQFDSYRKLIERRAAHEPCQYIVGKCEFMGFEFEVNSSVLIPRQDTETLVEEVLKIMPGRSRVLDLCTGSGAIAISLQRYRPDIYPTAADISAEALNVAVANARARQCIIDFVQSDLFEALDPNEKFDVIVSNPPYVSDAEYEELMPEVKDHEPALALKAGEKGLDIYERLIREAPSYLKEGGILALEIGCSQAEDVTRLMEEQEFVEIKVVKDLAGLDRVVIGYLKYKRED